MKIDPSILQTSQLLNLTEAVITEKRKEEWVGDAVLTLALRRVCVQDSISNITVGILSKNLNSIASNQFLANYASWLNIKGGANEIEQRFARLFELHGFEAVLIECRLLIKVWREWMQIQPMAGTGVGPLAVLNSYDAKTQYDLIFGQTA